MKLMHKKSWEDIYQAVLSVQKHCPIPCLWFNETH